MENNDSINISIESINNIIFDSIRHIRLNKRRPDIPTIIEYVYRNDENKNINQSTLTDRIFHLTNANLLENKRSNNKDSYFISDDLKNYKNLSDIQDQIYTPHDDQSYDIKAELALFLH